MKEANNKRTCIIIFIWNLRKSKLIYSKSKRSVVARGKGRGRRDCMGERTLVGDWHTALSWLCWWFQTYIHLSKSIKWCTLNTWNLCQLNFNKALKRFIFLNCLPAFFSAENWTLIKYLLSVPYFSQKLTFCLKF